MFSYIKKRSLICFLALIIYPSVIFSQEEYDTLQQTADTIKLKDVIVTYTPPVYDNKTDRFLVKINETALKDAGSAIDVLYRVAKVKVDEVYGIFVGTELATIYVDGREVTDLNILSMLSSQDMAGIEVITDPSAVYDAKGRVIINIKTNKKPTEGTELNLTGRLAKGEYMRQYIGANLQGRWSKFSLYSSFMYAPEKKLYNQTYSRDTYQNPYELYIRNIIDNKHDVNGDTRFRIGGEYRLSANHAVGTEINLQFKDEINYTSNINQIYLASNMDNPLFEMKSTGHNDLDRNYYTGNIFHRYTSSTGLNLKTFADISRYDNSRYSVRDDNLQSGTVRYIDDYNETKDQLIIQTDMGIPLSESYSLNIGAKYAYKDNESDIDITRPTGELIWSNPYNYNEKIGGMYAAFSGSSGNLDMNVGLRAEYSNIATESSALSKKNIDWNIFPNVSFKYNLTSDLSLNLGYSVNIYRPNFDDINPSRGYIDSLFYRVGNPELEPEKKHNITIKTIYKRASLSISYTRRNNAISWILSQDEDRPTVTKSIKRNIEKAENLSVDLLLPYENDIMNIFLATGIIYSHSKDEEKGISQHQTLWYAGLNMGLHLPWDLHMEMNHKYFTEGMMEEFYFKPAYRMDISFRKRMLKNRLAVTLMWNDVFKSDKMKTYSIMNGRNVYYNYSYDQSSIGLAVTYSFKL